LSVKSTADLAKQAAKVDALKSEPLVRSDALPAAYHLYSAQVQMDHKAHSATGAIPKRHAQMQTQQLELIANFGMILPVMDVLRYTIGLDSYV